MTREPWEQSWSELKTKPEITLIPWGLKPVWFLSLRSIQLFCWAFLCHSKTCQINSHVCLWVRDRLEACFSLPFALFCCPDCNRPSRAATANHPSFVITNPRESSTTQGKAPIFISCWVFPIYRNRIEYNAQKLLVLPHCCIDVSDSAIYCWPLFWICWQYLIFCTWLLSSKENYGISTPPVNLPYLFLSSPMVGIQLMAFQHPQLICHTSFCSNQWLAYSNRYPSYIAVLILQPKPSIH